MKLLQSRLQQWLLWDISKWVDNHVFISILTKHLERYNEMQKGWAQEISENGGKQHDGGKLWFKEATMPDDHAEEFDEDCSMPIQPDTKIT